MPLERGLQFIDHGGWRAGQRPASAGRGWGGVCVAAVAAVAGAGAGLGGRGRQGGMKHFRPNAEVVIYNRQEVTKGDATTLSPTGSQPGLTSSDPIISRRERPLPAW